MRHEHATGCFGFKVVDVTFGQNREIRTHAQAGFDPTPAIGVAGAARQADRAVTLLRRLLRRQGGRPPRPAS